MHRLTPRRMAYVALTGLGFLLGAVLALVLGPPPTALMLMVIGFGALCAAYVRIVPCARAMDSGAMRIPGTAWLRAMLPKHPAPRNTRLIDERPKQ
jgi:hypothetical protein